MKPPGVEVHLEYPRQAVAIFLIHAHNKFWNDEHCSVHDVALHDILGLTTNIMQRVQ